MRTRFLIMVTVLLASAPTAVRAADTDGDGFDDASDNCVEIANSTQCDTDRDGYGNGCDGDYSQDGVVGSTDVDFLLADLTTGVDSGVGTDHNCDGAVNSLDASIFSMQFARGAPGPSGLWCAGQAPCVDEDHDGIADRHDNCLGIANPVQCDGDRDGYGNTCDGDLDQDGVVNATDAALFQADLATGQQSHGVGSDLNCDGTVDFADASAFQAELAKGVPGPSGLSCAGSAYCTIDRTLVAMFNFADNVGENFTHAEALAVMEEVKAYYLENSYGRETLVGLENPGAAADVVGWIDTPLLAECDAPGQNFQSGLLDALSAEGVDWEAYDNAILVAPFVGCGWAALALSKPGTFTPVVNSLSFGYPVTVAHEFSHHFGSPHSGFLGCVGGSFGEDPSSSSCQVQGMGDPYTVTGSSLAHMTAREKALAGFIEPEQFVEVMESGTYTLTPLEVAGGLKGITTRRFPSHKKLHIEFRQAIGFDAAFRDRWGWTDYTEGAMIRDHSNLIDATPSPAGDRTTPTLPVGQTLTDPLTGNTVTVDSLVPGPEGSLTVTVDIANPYDYEPPAVEVLQPQPDADVWGEVTISAAATDAQGVKEVQFSIGPGPDFNRFFDQDLGTVTAPTTGNVYETSVDTATLEQKTWYVRVRARDNVAENDTGWISTPIHVLHVTQGCDPEVDGTVDADGDGLYNWEDNCPLSAPGNQTDSDADGIGDRCDCDFDNDGICADADADDAWSWWACKNWFDPVLCAAFDMNSDGVMNGFDQLLYDAAKSDGLPGPGACELPE